MSRIIQLSDHIMLLADYKEPQPHKHLATHIIISTEGSMEWNIDGKAVSCRGICVESDVTHSARVQGHKVIVFLFTEISKYTRCLREKYLKGNPYTVLPEKIVDRIMEVYDSASEDAEKMDKLILEACDMTAPKDFNYDSRIKKVLDYINNLETIDNTLEDQLISLVYLSRSRLSHLFKEETGMTLHGYVSFEKLRKTYRYICGGRNISESCMLAGFDSPSHCAATCKRMFGTAMRDIIK